MRKLLQNQEIQYTALFWFIRLCILFLVFLEFYSNREVILYLYIAVFFLTFFPYLIQKLFKFSFPYEFEFYFLLFLLASISFEKFFSGLLVQFIHGLFFGVDGFLIMYVLYHNSRIKSTYFLFIFISFCIGISLGVIWEVFRYSLMIITKDNIGVIGIETAPQGLILTILGSAIISTIGYFYLEYGEGKIMDGDQRLPATQRRQHIVWRMKDIHRA